MKSRLASLTQRLSSLRLRLAESVARRRSGLRAGLQTRLAAPLRQRFRRRGSPASGQTGAPPVERRLRWPPVSLPSLPGGLPTLPGGLRPWVTLASLGFVMAALTTHGRQLLQMGLDRQGWLWLVLGTGLSLLSVVVNGLAWTAVLRWLGHRVRGAGSVAFFMSTNLRKFLPGGIWHLAARLQGLLQGQGGLESAPTPPQALLAVVVEPLLAACAALSLVILGGWQGGLGLLSPLALALLQPRWLPGLLRVLERRKARELHLGDAAEPPLAPGERSTTTYPWQPLLVQIVFVLLRFAGFACCVWAFDLQLSLDWSSWLAAFALAWTVGLVVPGAPGGLGVFETVLLLRLGGALAAPSLLAVALSYRLIATLADVLAALLADLDDRLAHASASGDASS